MKDIILKDDIDGHVDSVRLLLNNRKFVNHNSEEQFMLRLLMTAMSNIIMYAAMLNTLL